MYYTANPQVLIRVLTGQVCTAFAAGNSVIVKPASQTPVSCYKMAVGPRSYIVILIYFFLCF